MLFQGETKREDYKKRDYLRCQALIYIYVEYILYMTKHPLLTLSKGCRLRYKYEFIW